MPVSFTLNNFKMKKILISFLVAMTGIFAAAPAHAQLFKFGVVTGLNLTKLKIKGDKGTFAEQVGKTFDSENRTGWYVGPKIWINTPLGIGLDGALQYSQRRLDVAGVGETYRSVEIPVNVRYNIGLGSIASVHVSTGPQFGFNVGGMDAEDWISSIGGNSRFSKQNMNTTWNVGAGIKLLGHLEVDLGYNFAISRMGKAILDVAGSGSGVNIPVGSYEVEYKTNTFQVQLAYIF